MKRRPHSGTPSRQMRESRVQASASPQVRAALASGQISLYRAGEIAKLPTGQQTAVLAQWADRSLCRTKGQAIAAKVIRRELRRHARVDLDRVASAIRAAIAMVA